MLKEKIREMVMEGGCACGQVRYRLSGKPLVELATQAEMLRLLIRKTAWEMDRLTQAEVEHTLSDKVSMCNFWANRLCCEAADRAMQVHGGMGYSRHKPFEHIYRHHRRYRITEGSEEIQLRKVAQALFA